MFRFESSNALTIGGSGDAFVIGTTTVTFTDTVNYIHIVWTKNGATNHLYKNGVDITPTITNTTFTAFTAGALWVVNGDGGSALPHGPADVTVSMPAVYTTVLSPAKVLNHYQLGTNSVPAGAGAGGLRFHRNQK